MRTESRCGYVFRAVLIAVFIQLSTSSSKSIAANNDCLYETLSATLKNKLSPHKFEIGIGDRVNLNTAKNKHVDAVFLGQNELGNFFFTRNDSQIVAFEQGRIELKNKNRVLEANQIQPLPEAVSQQGKTCAVGSTFNCVKFLNSIGKLNREFETELSTSPGKIYDDFYSRISAAEVAKRKAEFFKNRPANDYSYDPKAVPLDQIGERISVLKKYGITAEETTNVKDLIRHLQAGNPAIIDTAVTRSKISINYPKSGVIEKNGTLPSTGKGDGGHSVLVVNYFKDGLFSGKFLIVDSMSASVNLWTRKQVEDAMGFRAHVTLVSTQHP